MGMTYQSHPGGFPIEAFVSKLVDEAFNVAVLPGATRGDEQGLTAAVRKPLTDCFGYELRAIVTPKVPGHATKQGQPLQTPYHH